VGAGVEAIESTVCRREGKKNGKVSELERVRDKKLLKHAAQGVKELSTPCKSKWCPVAAHT
jgi:hypothetical protein